MKCIILAVVMTITAGHVLDRPKRSVDQPPSLLGLEGLNPPGFVITWLPVRELAGEPIDGYKVHVWELSGVQTDHYILVDGVAVKQVDNVPAKVDSTVPMYEAKVIDVPGADNTKVIYSPMKLGVQYEVRVQAYNREGTGLLSNALGIKLVDD